MEKERREVEGEKGRGMEDSLKEMERRMERREREERKKNVIIKRVVVKGTVKQTVEKLMGRMGVQGAIEMIRN